MKKTIKTVVATTVSLILAATLSFAADAKKGETTAAAKTAVAAPAADAKKGAADAKAAAKGKIVDINSATEAELKSIPGIGDAYASKIIAGRPYANKAQLKSRNILPATVYEQTKELMIAKQAKTETKAPAKKK